MNLEAYIPHLVLCNTLLPVIFTYHQCRSRRGVEINHVMMFSFGFFYYWISPVILGLSHAIDTDSLLRVWQTLYDKVPPHDFALYLVFSLAFYSLFCVGVLMGNRTRFVFGTALCTVADIPDFGRLARKWQESTDALSQHLRSLLSPSEDVLLATYKGPDAPSPDLCAAMLHALNTWLTSDVSVDSALMERIALTPYTRACLQQHPRGDLRLRVNHVVLQETYPAEIVRRIHLRSTYHALRFDARLLSIYMAAGLALASMYAYILRGDLFHGYLDMKVYTNFGPRGAFVGVSELLLAIALVYTLYRHPVGKPVAFFKQWLNPYILAYFGVAILVLSMGGRLYFVTSLCIVLIFRTVYYRRIPLITLLTTVTLVCVFAGLIGTARMGQTVSSERVIGSIFSEPLGTSTSLFSFLSGERFELFNFPTVLLSELTNLVPSLLLPNKANLLVTPEMLGYKIYAPVGALHSVPSFIINFGVVGSLIVVFLIGFGMSQLKRTQVRLFRVMYIMLTGWLGFSLFRDPFSVSLVKSMFEFSIVVPFLLALSVVQLHTWFNAPLPTPGTAPR